MNRARKNVCEGLVANWLSGLFKNPKSASNPASNFAKIYNGIWRIKKFYAIDPWSSCTRKRSVSSRPAELIQFSLKGPSVVGIFLRSEWSFSAIATKICSKYVDWTLDPSKLRTNQSPKESCFNMFPIRIPRRLFRSILPLDEMTIHLQNELSLRSLYNFEIFFSKMAHFRSLLLYFRLFNTLDRTNVQYKFAYDWIWTAYLWYRN